MVLQGLTFTNNSEKLCNYIGHILHTQYQSYWKLCTEINHCMIFLWIVTKKKKVTPDIYAELFSQPRNLHGTKISYKSLMRGKISNFKHLLCISPVKLQHVSSVIHRIFFAIVDPSSCIPTTSRNNIQFLPAAIYTIQHLQYKKNTLSFSTESLLFHSFCYITSRTVVQN